MNKPVFKVKRERLNLRMRCNNLDKGTKDDIINNLMKRHKLSDYDRAYMLYLRCMNDARVQKIILKISDCL